MMNTYTTFLLLFFLNFPSSLFAQNPLEKQWDKRYGANNEDQFTCIIQTADEGYMIGGWSNSGSSGDKSQPSWGDDDYWVVKTDASGNLQWEKRFGGNDFDVLCDVCQTTDGGYLLGGWSNSGISGDKTQNSWGNGYTDYWIVKIDGAGIKQWDKRFGGTDDEYLASVHQTSDGGYALGGYSYSGSNGDKSQPSWGGGDYWLVKTDALGNLQWDKRFGGNDSDYCTEMQLTSDGGFIMGGYTSSGANGDKTQPSQGFEDYWIVKTDSAGNIQWDKRFGGNQGEEMASLEQTNDGGYILGGASGSAANGDKTQPTWGIWDYWIIKVDSSGIKEWDKDLGGTDWEDLFGTISQTLDGGYLVSGTSYSPISGDKSEDNLGLEQAWIVKTDSLGIKEWDKTIFTEGHDELSLALQSTDGCYVIGVDDDAGIGGYKTENNWGAGDYWMVKFCDTTLVLPPEPAAAFSVSDTDLCEKFCISFFDSSLNDPVAWQWIFPGGDPYSSTDQNPLNICYFIPGVYDVTLITTNAFGTDTVVLHDLITVYPTPPIPTITQAGNTLTSGVADFYQWQFNSVDVPGATNQSYVFSQSGYYTVIVTDSNGCQNSYSADFVLTGIDVIESELFISLSPNPSTGKFTVRCIHGLPAVNFLLVIMNPLGQTVFSSHEFYAGNPSGWKKEIDLSGKLGGIYFVEIRTSEKLLRKKLMIN